MAGGEGIGYNTGTAVSVAADFISSAVYQRIKLVHGADGTDAGDVAVTNPLPVSMGPVQLSGTQMVTLAPGASVTIQQGVSVSAQISGTVSIGGTAMVSMVPGVSVVAVVSGTVSLGGITPVTTAASVSVAGLPVWIHPTNLTTVVSGTLAINTIATILGTQIVSVVPGLNVTVAAGTITLGGTTNVPSLSHVGGVVWIAGGQGTTVNPIFVSQINAPAAGGGSVTTAGPSVSATGQVMWLAGGQGTTAFPIFVSQINAPAAGGGSVTTAVPSVSATGQVMWIAGGQGTTAFPVVVTGTVSAGAGTTVVSVTGILLTTTAVTTGQAQAVWLMNPAGAPGTVNLSGVVPVTTAASVSVSGLPVWINPTNLTTVVSGTVSVNTILTIVTQLGTQIVSVVPGLSVNAAVSGIQYTTSAPSVTATGQVMWLAGGQSSTAFPIYVSQINPPNAGGGSTTTAPPAISAAGQVVWLAGGQGTTAFPVVVTGTVSAGAGTTVVSVTGILLTTTAVTTGLAQGVWVLNPGAGGGGAAGPTTTGVPSISATGQVVWLAGGQGTTAFPIVVTGTVSAGAGTTVVSVTGLLLTTTAVTTGQAQAVWVMNQGAGGGGTVTISGVVPVVTQASASVSGLPVWFTDGARVAVSGPISTISTIVTILGTQVITLANIAPVTTAASVSVSGLPVWINPTNLTTVISGTVAVNTIVTILGTQIVSVVPGLSVNAVVSGTITVSNTSPITSLPPSVSQAGIIAWIAGGQSSTAFPLFVSQINPPAAGGGSVTTAGPSVTATGQVVWLAGGQSSPTNPIFVSQLNPPAGGGGSVTTAMPSISATGQIMWIVGGQSSATNPVYVSGTIAAVGGTTVVSVTGILLTTTAVTTGLAQGVWVLNPGVGGGGAGPTTTGVPSISATGQVVWLAGGQGTTAFPIVVTGTVTAGAGTTVVSVTGLLLTTTAVTTGQAQAVWVMNPAAGGGGTVSISGVVPVTTAASVSVTGVPVWFNPTNMTTVVSGTITVNTVLTIVTQLGTQAITGTVAIGAGITTTQPAAGFTALGVWLATSQSINVANAPGLYTTTGVTTGTAQAVWLMNPTTVTVTIVGTTTGTVSLLNVVPTTTQVGAGVTGLPVYLAASQIVRVDPFTDNFEILLSNTVVAAGGVTVAFSVMSGTTMLAVGTTSFIIPGPRGVLIQEFAVAVMNSITTTPIRGQVVLMASAALPTFTATSPVMAGAPFAVGNASVPVNYAGRREVFITAGRTIAVAVFFTTATGTLAGGFFGGHAF